METLVEERDREVLEEEEGEEIEANEQDKETDKPAGEENQVPEDVEQEWREAFGMFDQNQDGCITFDELTRTMHCLGNNPTEAELRCIMGDLDVDKDGKINIDEFMRIMIKHWKDPVDEEKELMEAFQVFDRNRDGYVVAEEIKYVMHSLGHNLSDLEVDDIIRKADADGDGKLDYHEFVKTMQERLK